MSKLQGIGLATSLLAMWLLWQSTMPLWVTNTAFVVGIVLLVTGSLLRKRSVKTPRISSDFSETQGYLLDQYQRDAARTMASHDYVLAELGLGMGEAGEVQNKIKKIMFHGHPLNEANKTEIMEELGDVLWYVAGVGTVLGITLEDIASYNVLKLRKRYPNGFDTERSINRES